MFSLPMRINACACIMRAHQPSWTQVANMRGYITCSDHRRACMLARLLTGFHVDVIYGEAPDEDSVYGAPFNLGLGCSDGSVQQGPPSFGRSPVYPFSFQCPQGFSGLSMNDLGATRGPRRLQFLCGTVGTRAGVGEKAGLHQHTDAFACMVVQAPVHGPTRVLCSSPCRHTQCPSSSLVLRSTTRRQGPLCALGTRGGLTYPCFACTAAFGTTCSL